MMGVAETPAGSGPLVSVIMPIRNESDSIEQSLGSVLRQDYPSDRIEILVADGMSTDGTRDILKKLSAGDARIRVIDNPKGIAATGLNVALRAAAGDIIIRIDGHCEIAPDYVTRCVRRLTAGDAEGVGGPIATVGETPLARAIAAAMSSRFGVGDSAFRTRRGLGFFVDTIPFPAYTREVIERAGPYDEELVRNQDDEYNYRLRESGARLLLSEDLGTVYYSRSSFRSFVRQYFQYGLWKVRVLQKHHRQMQPRQFVPPLFILSLAGACAASFLAPKGWIPLALIGGAYAGTNLAASIKCAVRNGLSLLPLLPLTYAVLHSSYGVGFLCGLFKFAGRWNDRTGKVPTFTRKSDL
jgi:succinoglycan biosynthesis protein ExoA